MKTLLLALFFTPLFLFSQDMNYAHKVLDTLTSKSMHGRGYVEKGDKIAADYISQQFQKFNLNKFNKDYFQSFNLTVNTFPGDLYLKINGKTLFPGKDYIVDPASNGGKKDYNFNKSDKTKSTIEGMIAIKEEKKKLTLDVSHEVLKTAFIVLQSAIPDTIKEVSFKIENKLLKDYQTQNVIGYVKGTVYPDSFLVFTAHYDHLGEMGRDTYFPGANDNASGITMLLNLAEYYSKKENAPKYSIAFIAFSGEEAGLIGSHYFVEHPLFSLSKIKFLINMDIMGTGDEGMMVVNGAVFDEEYNRLIAINNNKHYLTDIPKRPKAAISDHYFFTEAGVRCFFFYTLGGIKAYHDIYDKAETLPLTKFEDIFRLIRDFVETF